MSAPPPPRPIGPPPPGVWVSAGFFVLAGALDFALRLRELPELAAASLWQPAGSFLLHLLLAAGLWRRLALCRAVAIVYCLASIVVYLFALGLAYSRAAPDVAFPASVVVESIFQIPSCVLLLPFLRSPRAAALFPRPLFG